MKTKFTIVTVLIALFLLMLAGVTSAKSFDDVPRSHWAYDAVEYLASKGLVEGFPDGTYQGQKEMTRYELAILVARAYAKLEEMTDENVTIDVEAIMNDLMDEFETELAEIRDLVKANKVKIDDLTRKLQENSEVDADLAAKLEKLGSKFKFNGTLKLRLDAKYYDPGNARKIRPRLSFRFDMMAPVNDELTFGGRLATAGTGGANVGSETTLTNEFRTKVFEIERAYLQWKPEAWPNWTVWCGKFKPNWVTPGNFIDSDVNVEGAAQTYRADNWVVNLAEMIPANKGGYIVAQVGAEDLITDNLDLYLTYHYVSSGAFETIWAGFPHWYRLDGDDYSAIEGYGKYAFDWMDWPVFVEAAYRMNLADEWVTFDSGLQQAAMAQITVGKIKEVHDYNFWLNYGRVLPNAIIPQFANSCYGVDHQTFAIGMGYKLMEHTLFKLTYVNAENLVSNPNGGFDYVCADIITDF